MINNIVFVISHRRSGTHFLIDAILNNFNEYQGEFLRLERLDLSNRKHMSIKDFRICLDKGPNVIKTHNCKEYDSNFDDNNQIREFKKKLLGNAKLIYIYRDGRDVLVSLYYYMQTFSEEIRNVKFSDFIRMTNKFSCCSMVNSLNRIEYWKYHVESWIESPGIFPISFEMLKNDYNETIERIGEFLGIKSNDKIRNVDIQKIGGGIGKILLPLPGGRRILKKFTQKIGYLDLSSIELRKGAMSEYKTHFLQEDLEFFDSITSDLMIKLGYKNEIIRNV